MNALHSFEVRKRVEDRIAGLEDLAVGLSPRSHDDTPSTKARPFYVQMLRSLDTETERSNARDGGWYRTELLCRFLYRIIPHEQIRTEDLAAALAIEIISTVMADEGAGVSAWPGPMQVFARGYEIQDAEGDYTPVEVLIDIEHRQAFQ